jgi:hypothetical protein
MRQPVALLNKERDDLIFSKVTLEFSSLSFNLVRYIRDRVADVFRSRFFIH